MSVSPLIPDNQRAHIVKERPETPKEQRPVLSGFLHDLLFSYIKITIHNDIEKYFRHFPVVSYGINAGSA